MKHHLISLAMLACLSLSACKSETNQTPQDDAADHVPASISAEPSTEKNVSKKNELKADQAKTENAAKKEQASTLSGHVTFSRRNDKGNLEVFLLDLAKKGEPKRLHAYQGETNSNLLFPLWSKDSSRIEFSMYEGETWIVASIKPDGSDLQKDPAKTPDMLSRNSRAKDITVEHGKILIKDGAGKDVELYAHDAYDPKNNAGPAEASWGPEKKHVIFELCGLIGCEVRIVDTQGTLIRTISDAEMPDWSAGS